VLTVRRSATAVVCAQRTTGAAGADARASWRYLHLVADDLCLDEVVEPTGLHRFGFLRPADVADVLLDWLAPDGADGVDGPPQRTSARAAADGTVPVALLERLATAHVVGDVLVRRADEQEPPALLGTFAGPGMLRLSVTREGRGDDVEPCPVSRDTLRALLDRRVGGEP
jgi:hypothetical protein